MIHGGDVYQNEVNMDFSVSINPLRIPGNITDALKESINAIGKYPDIHCTKLTDSFSKKYGIEKDAIVFGNGSSELFMAIAHALKPKKVLIPVPSFLGYAYAFSANSEEINYYPMKEEDNFILTKDVLDVLTPDYDVIIIANPNNPTGARIDKALLEEILNKCLKENIKVILDECFIEFTHEESLIGKLNKYPNLCIIRSFTKIFAIPNVRLGYMLCSDHTLVDNVKKHLPEWNVSGFAQKTGLECLKCDEFVRKSRDIILKEKEFLEDELKKLGIKVFPSDCNYILFYDERPLYDCLLKEKILIRNCDNFRGLKKGFYRIAVKSHEDNLKLIEIVKTI